MSRLGLAKSLVLFVAVAIPLALFAASAFAAGPTGASPNDPLMVPTGPQSIDGGKTLWFYFDYALDSGGRGFGRRALGKPPAQVAVDANGVGGLAFGIYTPDEGQSWIGDPSTKPVGRGTPYTDTSSGNITHDLYWAGGFNLSGRYLIAVTNSNATPVTFTMTVAGDNVTLYPPIAAAATPTLYVPITVTPVPTGTIAGKIVFENQTGGEIWTVNGDGLNLTRVSRGIDPTWSSDGTKIVFARWDNTNPGLFMANADGSNEQLVFAAPQIRWPRMSPDGKYIVFSRNKSTDKKTIWKLGMVELATGKLYEPQCSDLCYVPSWAPDSATIVFTDPNIGILQTNAFSGAPSYIGPNGRWWDSNSNISRPIVNWPPIEDTELSPDGHQLVFAMQAQDRWEINLMTADGSIQTGITNPDPIASILFGVVDHNVAPTWSPDGKQILFLSDRNGKWQFFVMDSSGNNVKQVLTQITDLVPIQFGYYNERIMDWTK